MDLNDKKENLQTFWKEMTETAEKTDENSSVNSVIFDEKESKQFEITDIYSSLHILGNGNTAQGLQLLKDLARNTAKARVKHNSDEWKDCGEINSIGWLSDEVKELSQELRIKENAEMAGYNNKQRVKEECLDVLTVGVRIYNREWE